MNRYRQVKHTRINSATIIKGYFSTYSNIVQRVNLSYLAIHVFNGLIKTSLKILIECDVSCQNQIDCYFDAPDHTT